MAGDGPPRPMALSRRILLAGRPATGRLRQNYLQVQVAI